MTFRRISDWVSGGTRFLIEYSPTSRSVGTDAGKLVSGHTEVLVSQITRD